MKRALKNGYLLSVVGALLVGGAVGWLVFGRPGSTSNPPPKPAGNVIQVSLRRGIYPSLGLGLEQPTSWLTSSETGLLSLSSPDDGATTVAISDPAPAGEVAKLRPAINSQLVKTFEPAKIIGRRTGPIGVTPALTTAIIGTTRTSTKTKVLVLSTAVTSKYRTYSIQVLFKSLSPSPQSLLEVQHMLASIRFFAPTS
ncbi:MAG TPA: hypothetical protein VG165_02015 [Solirubrobacteraceae bacterium]|nr:hypothetical protein [Solirubrobacteraceae bacterium]